MTMPKGIPKTEPWKFAEEIYNEASKRWGVAWTLLSDRQQYAEVAIIYMVRVMAQVNGNQPILFFQQVARDLNVMVYGVEEE
jgi:hypothetical protein